MFDLISLNPFPAATPPEAPGKIAYFGMSAVPTGWLECNGSAVSRTTYAALFAAIGTTWGAGDGLTTFNLPELRAEHLRGWDHGRGVDPARAFASAQADALQGHFHSNTASGTDGYSATADTSTTGGFAGVIPGASGVSVTVNIGNPSNDGTHGVPRTGSETRGRNVAVLPCIKI